MIHKILLNCRPRRNRACARSNEYSLSLVNREREVHFFRLVVEYRDGSVLLIPVLIFVTYSRCIDDNHSSDFCHCIRIGCSLMYVYFLSLNEMPSSAAKTSIVLAMASLLLIELSLLLLRLSIKKTLHIHSKPRKKVL